MEQTMKLTQAKPKTSHGALKLGSIAAALALLQAPAWAVDYVWQGGNGVWDDAGRWTLLGVPGSSDSATIQNTGTGAVLVRDPRSVGQLFINGNLTSTSTLTVGSLSFASGYFGRVDPQGAGGVMNVNGPAVFSGAGNQRVDYSHVINLAADTAWFAGNGRLEVATSYSSGAEQFATAALNIGAGTTFADHGAASAAGFKVIGGGEVNNHGRYLRTGVGATYARGFNNFGTLNVAEGDFIFERGNWQNTSSGLVQVASGSTLTLANVTFTQGSVVNNGLVRQYGNDVVVASAAQISGAWQLDDGRQFIEGAQAVSSLVINGGQLTGTGVLTTGSLVFNFGKLGGSGMAGGGVLNVTGPATFNGQNQLDLNDNHTLNLNGNSRWTAGFGRIDVASASSSGPGATVNIGAGTTFTDEGAAAAGGFKVIGGGAVNNHGSYLRTGVGETVARGFNNLGTLAIASGTMSVNADFSNTGTVDIAAGALLRADSGSFVNDGLLTGSGVVETFSANHALLGNGSIDPGAGMTPGTLTIDGDLTLSGSAVLHIDLASGGVSDKLAVTSDALLRGELSVWGGSGLTLQLGDVYTIASFTQRVSNSTFDSISWHGLDADQFTVEYTADSVLLRVTAVPEPATWALAGLGVLIVLGAARRRRPA